MTTPDATYFEDLRARLRGALILVSANLPADVVALVEELIDANECGEALVFLCEALTEAGAHVDQLLVNDLAGLARTMRLEPDPTLWLVPPGEDVEP